MAPEKSASLSSSTPSLNSPPQAPSPLSSWQKLPAWSAQPCASRPHGQPLAHSLPGIRDWLAFTTEHKSEKSLCLLVGVAGRGIDGEAAQFLRPIKAGSPLSAHIHAAVFPYRPVQRGELPFAATVAGALASTPSAVLHLMADTRRFEGVGETELARGAVWMGPLHSIARA